MRCAPVIIPTLCRSEHFVRLMESLRKNSWAIYTDVYVGLDYPPSDKYKEGYNKICHYLSTNTFSEFASIHIIKRPFNYGAARNSRELRDLVLHKYDRFIRTDDDVEFSPNFLEYMNKCLDFYEDDPDVVAVTGYSYPINWSVSEGASTLKEDFSCPMWGTGFWRNKFTEINSYIISGRLAQTVPSVLFNDGFSRMMKRSQIEYVACCLSANFQNTLASKMSDVAMRMYTAINCKYVIVPTVSKVRNWGFDGSGQYCQNIPQTHYGHTADNYPYFKQPIDREHSFHVVEDQLQDVSGNKLIMDRFDSPSLMQKMKMNIKRYVYLICGIKLYQRIFRH